MPPVNTFTTPAKAIKTWSQIGAASDAAHNAAPIIMQPAMTVNQPRAGTSRDRSGRIMNGVGSIDTCTSSLPKGRLGELLADL
jgi:hypothetical protein